MLYGDSEVQETVDAIEQKKQPRVAVSLDQLKRIELGEHEVVTRYFDDIQSSHVPFDEKDSYLRTAKLNPELGMHSLFDHWNVYTGRRIGVFRPTTIIYEERRKALNLPDWLPYITTAFLQDRPDKFLEYLRLMLSVKGNPWVEPVFKGVNVPNGRYLYVDPIIGKEYAPLKDGYPPKVMYPHTISENGDLDFSITLDRFTETLTYDALGQAFTTLDITRITDPDYLEWAYEHVLNTSKYVKSQVGEPSIVRVIQDGKTIKTLSFSIHPDMQELMQQRINDVLQLLKSSTDKLAMRNIEVRALKAKGIEPEFIGPQWLNPLTPVSITQEEIDAQLRPLPPLAQIPTYNFPQSLMHEYSLDPQTDFINQQGNQAPGKEPNLMLPLTGAAVAALGLYAATR